MQYKRRFAIQAAHFNGEEQYRWYDKLTEHSPMDVWENMGLACDIIRESHGHDFIIEVELAREPTPVEPRMIISDEEITELVMRWNNTNLSVHPDFAGGRATTEMMAKVLALSLAKLVDVRTIVEVSVTETANITASYIVEGEKDDKSIRAS